MTGHIIFQPRTLLFLSYRNDQIAASPLRMMTESVVVTLASCVAAHVVVVAAAAVESLAPNSAASLAALQQNRPQKMGDKT